MSELKDPEVPDTNQMLYLLLIQSMRNYDVMMHILAHFDEEVATELGTRHENHEVLCPLPYIIEPE